MSRTAAWSSSSRHVPRSPRCPRPHACAYGGPLWAQGPARLLLCRAAPCTQDGRAAPRGQGAPACPLTSGGGLQYPDSPINVLRISPGVPRRVGRCACWRQIRGGGAAVQCVHVHACVRARCLRRGEARGAERHEVRARFASRPERRQRTVESVTAKCFCC